MDYESLFTGWTMLSLAIGLFLLSFSIWLLGLEGVFASKRFPEDTDTPCMLAFFVLGLIFLNLGVIYRDMAVHPELFEQEAGKKEEKARKKEEWHLIKSKAESGEEDMGDLLDSGEP